MGRRRERECERERRRRLVGGGCWRWPYDARGSGAFPTPPSTASSFHSLKHAGGAPSSSAAGGGGGAAHPRSRSRPARRRPAGGPPRRKRATREQLEAALHAAKDDLETHRASAHAEAESLRAQLDRVSAALAAAEQEREASRAQVVSTQATHAALVADHNQLVSQHRRAEGQIQSLEAEVDALRGNEMRLLPDLQRWLALTEQLASMLAAAKAAAGEVAGRIAPLTDLLVVAAPDGGEGQGNGGGEGEGAEIAAAARRLQPHVAAFDAALEAAIPNLVVAKPWLSELLQPLQQSMHAIVSHAGGWPDVDAAFGAAHALAPEPAEHRDRRAAPSREATRGRRPGAAAASTAWRLPSRAPSRRRRLAAAAAAAPRRRRRRRCGSGPRAGRCLHPRPRRHGADGREPRRATRAPALFAHREREYLQANQAFAQATRAEARPLQQRLGGSRMRTTPSCPVWRAASSAATRRVTHTSLTRRGWAAITCRPRGGEASGDVPRVSYILTYDCLCGPHILWYRSRWYRRTPRSSVSPQPPALRCMRAIDLLQTRVSYGFAPVSTKRSSRCFHIIADNRSCLVGPGRRASRAAARAYTARAVTRTRAGGVLMADADIPRVAVSLSFGADDACAGVTLTFGTCADDGALPHANVERPRTAAESPHVGARGPGRGFFA